MTDQITTKTPEDALTMRWLQMATHKHDARPVLKGIHTEDGTAVSSDGFRLHHAPVPGAMEILKDGSTSFINNGKRIPKGAGRIFPVEDIPYPYPDWKSVRPTGLPIAMITVNKEFLRDACEMPDNENGMYNANHITLKINTGFMDPLIVTNGNCTGILYPLYTDEDIRAMEIRDRNAKVDRLCTIAEKLKDKYPDIYRELELA